MCYNQDDIVIKGLLSEVSLLEIYTYHSTQEPRKIVMGQYHKKVRRGNKVKDIRKTDDAYYIPLLESVEQLLNDDSILEEVCILNLIN